MHLRDSNNDDCDEEVIYDERREITVSVATGIPSLDNNCHAASIIGLTMGGGDVNTESSSLQKLYLIHETYFNNKGRGFHGTSHHYTRVQSVSSPTHECQPPYDRQTNECGPYDLRTDCEAITDDRNQYSATVFSKKEISLSSSMSSLVSCEDHPYGTEDDKLMATIKVESFSKNTRGMGLDRRSRRRNSDDEDEEDEILCYKRLVANGQERRRMHRLNCALEELRTVLPQTFHGYSRRLSKIKTLRIAIAYIGALKALLLHYTNNNNNNHLNNDSKDMMGNNNILPRIPFENDCQGNSCGGCCARKITLSDLRYNKAVKSRKSLMRHFTESNNKNIKKDIQDTQICDSTKRRFKKREGKRNKID